MSDCPYITHLPHKQDESIILFAGSPLVFDGVNFTPDQYRNLHRWNGTTVPKPKTAIDRHAQSRTDMAMCRRASRDGLRMMAILSEYLEPFEDPVELLLMLLRDQGYDVPYIEEGEDDDDLATEE